MFAIFGCLIHIVLNSLLFYIYSLTPNAQCFHHLGTGGLLSRCYLDVCVLGIRCFVQLQKPYNRLEVVSKEFLDAKF